MNKIAKYYLNQKYALIEMVKQLKYKEFAIRRNSGMLRPFNCGCSEILQKNLEAFKCFEEETLMYKSVCYIDWSKVPKEVKVFSYNPEKKKEQNELFKKNLSKCITNFDLCLDFDICCIHYTEDNEKKFCNLQKICVEHKVLCKNIFTTDCKGYKNNFMLVKEEVSRLKKEFDSYGVPYDLIYSGTGFHITIKDKFLPDLPIKAKIDFCGKFASEVRRVFNLTSLDPRVRCDKRALIKLPYSIAYDYVVLPLTDIQFEHFTHNMVKVENVLKNIKLFKRSEEPALNRSGDRKNFLKFCKEYGIRW